jgi:hypothetical protein
MKIILFSTIICYLLEIVFNKCGIDFLKKPKRVFLKQQNENKRLLKEADWEPIRIHLDFSFIENNVGRGKVNKIDLLDLRDNIMPKTKDILEKLLKVKRIQNKLKLNAPNCDAIPIPEKYHSDSEGVDADLVIFVMIDDTGFFLENKIEAAAIHCLQHSETRRPIAGYIQFKPELKVTNSTALDYMVWLSVHEITHILVMNSGLYDDYINPDSLAPLGIDTTLSRLRLPDGRVMNTIKSKKVMDKAQNHFGCNDFAGVPLEFNGGPGTAGAHWSKKFMNTDVMIGDSYGENLISDITLALFEDSGWYKVDYDQANLFIWGKNKGCKFFNYNKKCIEKKNTKYTTDFEDEFCTRLNYPTCSTSHIFRATCGAKVYKYNLPEYQRYFDDPKIGGNDPLTDKCPIAYEEKGDQTYYGGSCRVGDTGGLSELEKVCPECSCFLSTLRKSGQTSRLKLPSKKLRFKQIKEFQNGKNINNKIISEKTPAYKYVEIPELGLDDPMASCYQFKCEGKDLYVIINVKSYRCPSEEDIKIDGYMGLLRCPQNNILCSQKFLCKFGCTEMYSNSNPFVKFREN